MGEDRSGIRSHRDLDAWERAVELSVSIYRLTTTFPREEIYGLSAQLRRAAASVVANIAEGSGRRTTRDFVHFLTMA